MISEVSRVECRYFIYLLILGVFLRLLNLSHPILDAMAFRQTQTADAIRSLIEEPGFQLDSNASWRGSLPARVVQELPVYTYLSQGLYEIINGTLWKINSPKPGGADPHLIDISGRLVSVAFWALAFILLQGIWRRILTEQEAFFANLLFVIAPLSVFFGQAVMPEMVFLAVTFGFLLAVLRYVETPSANRFAVVTVMAILGCLIKFPAFSHLGLVAVAMMVGRHGWRFLIRPIHWVGVILVGCLMIAWSRYVTSVNLSYFEDWTPSNSVIGFIGHAKDRLDPRMYLKIFAYDTAFILTPLGVLVGSFGLKKLWTGISNKTSSSCGFIWVASLLFYILVWGVHTASGHSYYNLPMLGPACLVFGMGAVRMNEWLSSFRPPFIAAGIKSVFGGFILVAAMAGSLYLFQQDRQMFAVGDWVRNNTPPDEIVGIKLNHRPDGIDYQHIPCISYYSGRQCYILSRALSDTERNLAAKEMQRIVITYPLPNSKKTGWTQKASMLTQKIRGSTRPIDNMDWFPRFKSDHPKLVFFDPKAGFSVYGK